MANAAGVLVIVELADGKPISLVFEQLGLAKRLSEKLGGSVAVALLGSGVEAVAQDLIAQGADKVYVAEHPLLSDYQSDAWLPVVAKIVEAAAPAAILVGNTTLGTDLAPRLAFRLGAGVAMGCVEMNADGGKLQAVRSCFGNKAREKISFKTAVVVATIKPKSQEPFVRDGARSGETIKIAVDIQASAVRTTLISREKEKTEGVKLENASVVVAGGRGLGGPEGFRDLEKLAGLLKGAVGASRVAVDLGWVPPSWQIGLTGKTVTPEVYFAIGISGASHHLAGCGGSKAIVAINSDAEAAIFNDAKFGIIGDLKAIVPALIEEVRKAKA